MHKCCSDTFPPLDHSTSVSSFFDASSHALARPTHAELTHPRGPGLYLVRFQAWIIVTHHHTAPHHTTPPRSTPSAAAWRVARPRARVYFDRLSLFQSQNTPHRHHTTATGNCNSCHPWCQRRLDGLVSEYEHLSLGLNQVQARPS